jgi:Reverse transcriptase (RNA-dependent DNA polymerase)
MENFTLAGIMHEEEDPKSITDALSRQNGQEWLESLQSELQSMKNHHVWDLVPQKLVPIGKKVIKSKTICHIKHDENRHIAKLKTRIVAKGFTQIAGEDYHDMFSPVAKLESLFLILAIAAKLDWELRQLNVKTAFLHAELDKEIYMEQPEGGIIEGYEDHMCKLRKGIYGLKQAGRQWNKTLDKAMLKHGFNRISADHCVYMQSTSQGKSMIAVHTDDMAVAASIIPERDSILRGLRSMFDITHLGDIRWMLGIEICRDRDNRTISMSHI